MPYRRSRLQDYYEQLLGDKPSNDERDQDEEESSAEPEQDLIFPWLVPQPQPEPEVISVTPMINLVPNKPQALESPNIADPSPSESIGQASSSDSGMEGSAVYSQKQVLPDFGEDEPIRFDSLASAVGPDVYGNTPLTPGQAMDVDYLLSFVTDTLAREVLITLKRDGIPPRSQRNDFMSQYAEWGWDETSDALALEMIDIVEQSEMDEQLAHADRPEPIIRQEEHYIILSVDGGLKVHEDVEGILRGDAASSVLPVIPDDFSILVLDQYPLHPYAVKIYVARNEFWIDLRDDAVELEFERIDEVPQLYKPLRAQVSGQEYDNTSLDFMSALTKALESQPIGVIHISGTLKIYRDQNLDELGSTIDHVDHEFGVYKFSKDNQHAVLIDYVGQKIWIDTSDAKTEFTSVAHGEHGYTSIHSPEEIVANGNQSGDEILPIIPDEKAHSGSLDIEGDVARWDELEKFVNTDLAELQRRAVENPEIIRENMALLEHIFGYNVKFSDDDFFIGEGKNEEKRSAITQVFNIASSHYHVTNTFGIENMRTTATDTIYHLGADTITKTKYHGLVPLAPGSKNAFIGSKMTIGGITHETFHEIDRRNEGRFSVPNYEKPEGGLEWYLKNKVGRLEDDDVLGFNFGMMVQTGYADIHLNEDSRASDEEVNQEIFPDVAAAVVFGLQNKDFFSKAFEVDKENRIGFADYNNYVKSLICGIHQYFEHIASGVTEPEQLTYDEGACEQFWSEQ